MTRKRLIMPLLLMMVMVFLTACGTSDVEPAEEQVGIANPIVEYDTLDEINAMVGSELAEPDADELSDVSYTVIDGAIAQYQFTTDGVCYTYRAAQDPEEDISGVYSGEGLLIDNLDDEGYAADEQGKIFAWTVEKDGAILQYVLYAEDGGALSEDEFKAVVSDLRNKSV